MDTSASPSLRRSFELHLRAENRADNTIASYLESIRQAEAFLATLGKGLLDADRGDLETFLADLLARRSASTAATRYKALRILYGWLEEEGEISANPIAKMRPPIVPEQPVPIVPDDGLRRLLATCAGRDFDARRDTALIMFFLDTGARRGEAAGLKLADLDFDYQVAMVLGKGRRERSLPFGRKTALAWTATFEPASATATASCRGCGWGSVGSSPHGGSSRCSATEAGRPACQGCTPTSSATPSVTSGAPRVVTRPTSCALPAGGPLRCCAAMAPLPPTPAPARPTAVCHLVTGCKPAPVYLVGLLAS
jgi:Phage integrase family/Phage integrase, N-terminal SAM-like domain